MKESRCPYHVKQGHVDAEGKLVLSNICGMKTANGALCPFASGTVLSSYKSCERFIAYVSGLRQVVAPKNDIEFLPDAHESRHFSEIEYL